MGFLTNPSHLPLGLRRDICVLPSQLHVLKVIENFPLGCVRERLLSDRVLVPDEVEEAIFECRRFLALVYLTEVKFGELGAISEPIDAVWHQFILFTRLYSEFCAKVFGGYVHHLPGTVRHPPAREAEQNVISTYQQYFGDIPELWQRRGRQWSTTDGIG